MIEYNLAAEYASLIMIIAILISFTRDYDSKTLNHKCIKYTYVTVLATVLSTIISMLCGVPGVGKSHIAIAYITNIVYFALIPSVSLCYLIYTIIVTRLKYNEGSFYRSIIPACIPYGVYLLILFTNIHNKKVFYVTEEQGYVRGPWYQMPFILIAVNIVIIIILMLKHRSHMQRSSSIIMWSSALLAIGAIALQALNPNMIMTGIICTMSILSIHLYIQNVRKSSDQLTGLENRMALMYRIDSLAKKEEPFSLYVFSLRGFKMINERYGLSFGDKVLTHTATTFTHSFPYNAVFRYTGDEFALLLPHNNGQYDDTVLALSKAFDKPLTIDGNELFLDVVYARVDYGAFGTNVKDLISCADYSISVIKRSTGNIKYIYDTSVVKDILGSIDMVQQLKYALANDKFEIHYQPIYCAKTKQFVQAEALVRMRNKAGELLYPNSFIDLAERTGLIVPMTYMILDHVCEDLRFLLDTYGDDCILDSISVNFPYLQFITPNMCEDVMKILDKYNLETHRIKIEITERTMISDTETVHQTMDQMLAVGFIFELDDFGVDYSNMHTFLKLPINIIKLDRALLLATCANMQNMNFFMHIVAGILSTGRQVIVEGVEDSHQVEFALECECEYIQGYYFSKPLCFEDFKEIIAPKNQQLLLDKMNTPLSH